MPAGHETVVLRWRFWSTDCSIARSTRSVSRIFGVLEPQPAKPAPASATAIRQLARVRTGDSKANPPVGRRRAPRLRSTRGRGLVVRTPAFQAGGHGFDPRRPYSAAEPNPRRRARVPAGP